MAAPVGKTSQIPHMGIDESWSVSHIVEEIANRFRVPGPTQKGAVSWGSARTEQTFYGASASK